MEIVIHITFSILSDVIQLTLGWKAATQQSDSRLTTQDRGFCIGMISVPTQAAIANNLYSHIDWHLELYVHHSHSSSLLVLTNRLPSGLAIVFAEDLPNTVAQNPAPGKHNTRKLEL